MSVMLWVFFILFILFMLALDLLVFQRKAHEIKIKEALLWSGIWIGLALLFNAGIYIWQGKQPALEFLTGYLLEKSLSVDNLFVFLMIFSYFKVPQKYQHEILFWGILGALIFRAGFIVGGITLINKFHWIIYLFGGFLVFTGVKMAFEKDKEMHPEKSLVLRFFNRVLPVAKGETGSRFFIKMAGKWLVTPLFLVLLIVETTDIIFAFDSIPAILAITQKPFIVYTSNVFAILGLRALYFALSGIMKYFHHLHYGLSLILVFVGAKMLLADIFKIPVGISLVVIAGILLVSIFASMRWPKKQV
ncbi:MAG: TerC family protein [Candidatus Omnitrophica bacterium]|nr:TerC family protein [Candidatus Omnitrophota bacterium]